MGALNFSVRVRREPDQNPVNGASIHRSVWEDIDAVVSDRPVWLRRIDGHAGWANSKALELAGIDNDTPDPVGGKIIRDSQGRATGVLIDRAMDLVSAQVPAPNKSDLRAAIKAAHEAFPAWAALSFTERSQYMLKAAEEFERRRDDLVAALKNLRDEPQNESRYTQLVQAFEQLGPRQGAVLPYAPYIGLLLSDDPFSF